MHTLPVNRWTLLLGRIIGSVVYLTLSSVITIAATKILYNTDWNGNPLVIVSTIVVFCSITVGIGILIGLFIKSFSTSLVLVMLFMIFFGSFSGSVSPESTNNTINFLIPNYHAKVLLFGTIHGYSKQVMMEAFLWLLGMFTLIYSSAALVIGRKSYDNI
jgi:ABC-type transport system involved in multi-copper enzyme maturation permease subunit